MELLFHQAVFNLNLLLYELAMMIISFHFPSIHLFHSHVHLFSNLFILQYSSYLIFLSFYLLFSSYLLLPSNFYSQSSSIQIRFIIIYYLYSIILSDNQFHLFHNTISYSIQIMGHHLNY